MRKRKLRMPGKMFARMVLAFTCVLVVVVLFLSVVLYHNFEKTGIRLMKETNLNLLAQMSYSADYMNDNARNFAYTVFNDPAVTTLMYRDDSDFRRLFLDLNRFRQMVEANTFVHSLTIYNQRLNTVWTIPENGGSGRPDDRLNTLLKLSAGREDGLKPIPRTIDSAVRSPDDTPRYANVYTYVIYDLVSGESGIEGAVIVDIKSDYLNSILESLNAKYSASSGETFIIDRNGEAVLHSGRQTVGDEAMGTMLRQVREAGALSGSFIGTDGRKRMMVTYASSEQLGWKFVKVIPYETITRDIDRIRQVTVWVCLALLAGGFAAAFVISRWIYSPLRQLVGEVRSKSAHDAGIPAHGTDEVSLLSNAFAHTYDKASRHELAERSMLELRKNKLLRNLLIGAAPLQEFGEDDARFGNIMPDPGSGLRLVALRLDRFRELMSSYTPQDRALLRYALCNAAKESISREFRCEAVEMDDDLIVLIAATGRVDRDAESMHSLAEEIERLYDWTTEHLKLGFTASIGRPRETWRDLPESYQDVMNGMKYRFTYGHGAIITPDMANGRLSDPYRLPLEREKELADALTSGNAQQAARIYAGIIEETGRYSYDTMMSTFLYITYLIYNTMLIMESNSLYSFQLNINLFSREIGELETLEEVNGKFNDLFGHIATVIKEKKNKRSTVLTGKIAELIETHYKDKSLCLESIASTFDLTKLYIGKLFRDEFGKSVAEYITDVRLRKVMELIGSDPSRSLDDLLDEVGFENKNYFYKLFKSRVGVSYNDYKLRNFKERDIRL